VQNPSVDDQFNKLIAQFGGQHVLYKPDLATIFGVTGRSVGHLFERNGLPSLPVIRIGRRLGVSTLAVAAFLTSGQLADLYTLPSQTPAPLKPVKPAKVRGRMTALIMQRVDTAAVVTLDAVDEPVAQPIAEPEACEFWVDVAQAIVAQANKFAVEVVELAFRDAASIKSRSVALFADLDEARRRYQELQAVGSDPATMRTVKLKIDGRVVESC
jgi:hypothetical protein